MKLIQGFCSFKQFTSYPKQIVFTQHLKTYPGASQIFVWNQFQNQTVVEQQIETSKVTIFKDHCYLSKFVNKFYNNTKNKALRFDFAEIDFIDENFMKYIYDIIGCMEVQESYLQVKIKKDVLNKLFNNQFDNEEFYKKAFIQKLIHIGYVYILKLKPIAEMNENDQFIFQFKVDDSKFDIIDEEQRIICYEHKNQCFEQRINKKVEKSPANVLCELFPL